MLYALLGFDRAGAGERRRAVREEHLARMRTLQQQGRVRLAGPFPAADAADLSAGVSGSLIVAEFPSLDEARAWFEADPYFREDVYARWDVRPFLEVFPE